MPRWKLKDLFWISGETEDESPEELVAKPVETVQSALSTLRDVNGVVGSIAARPDGAVVGYDLPRTFDASRAEGAARQMSLLASALARDAGGMKTGTLRYSDFHFHVDEFPSGLIGVLASERTDRPELRMAVRLVGRRVEAALSGGTARPSTAPATR